MKITKSLAPSLVTGMLLGALAAAAQAPAVSGANAAATPAQAPSSGPGNASSTAPASGFAEASQTGPVITLEAAINEALEKSEESQILEQDMERLRARKSQAWAEGMPRVTGYATAGRGVQPFDVSSFSPLTSAFGDIYRVLDSIRGSTAAPGGGPGGGAGGPGLAIEPQNRYSYGVEAQQVLFNFGRLGKAVQGARIYERQVKSSYSHSRKQLKFNVLNAYFGAVLAEASAHTLRRSLERQKETMEFLERNWSMGSGVKADILMNRAAVLGLEPQLVQAEVNAAVARINLNRMLGRPLDTPFALDTVSAWTLPGETVTRMTTEEAYQKAVATREDLKALRYGSEVLNAQADYMKMLYRPTLAAQGKLGILAFDVDQLADWDNREWQVGVGLNWTIFDGLSNSAQARQFRADARTLEYNGSIARKSLRMEIESAVRQRDAADQSLAAANEAAAAAAEARSLLKEQFNLGKGRLMDLLSAEQTLREAQLGALNARYQKTRAEAALRLALGQDIIKEENR